MSHIGQLRLRNKACGPVLMGNTYFQYAPFAVNSEMLPPHSRSFS